MEKNPTKIDTTLAEEIEIEEIFDDARLEDALNYDDSDGSETDELEEIS